MSGQLGELVVSLSADMARFRSDMGKAVQVAQGTANDISRSLDGINGSLGSFSSQIALAATKFNMITAAAQAMAAGIRAVMSPAIDAVENYQASVMKTAAMIVSMQGGGGDIAENYRNAKMYAEGVQEALVQMDARSIASARQIQIMNEEFVKAGVLIDTNNQKQLDGYENIANALAVLASGMQNPDLQFSQEVRGLLSGEDKATNALFRQLQAIDPLLKDHLKTWKEQGTLIEHVGDLLIGYKAASGDIQSLWTTIRSTFSTMVDQVLRGGMVIAFQDIVQVGISINTWIKEHREILGQVINRGWLAMKGIIESVKIIIEPFAPMLKGIGATVAKIAEGWGLIAAVALPTVAEKLIGIVKIGVYIGEIFANVFNIVSDFIAMLATGIGSTLAAIVQAMSGDFEGAKNTLAGSLAHSFKQGMDEAAKNIKSMSGAIKSEFSNLFDFSGFDKRMSAWNATQRKSGGGSAPDVKPGRAEDESKDASLWSQAHDKYLAYLKAFSAKQAEIVKAASQLQQELNQEAYDNGLISHQHYLDKKLTLSVGAITAESDLKKAEIDRYKNEASKYSNRDSAKDAAAYHEALTKQATAEKELISLESRLAIVRLQGAQAAKQAAESRLNELANIRNSTPDRFGNTNEFASRMQDTNSQLKKYQQDEEMKTAILQKSKAQQLAVQQKFDDQMLQSQFDAAGKAADLMVEIGNNSKGAQLAALAIQTTIAVAQIQIAGRVAQMQALAQLGPIAGAAAAAQIEAMMWVNTGLTLAAGVVRGAKIDGARANGGPVTAGQTYIVNENRATQGPEYFTPSVSGYITPANKIGGQSVNSTTVFQISTGVADTVRAEIARLAPSLAEMSVGAVRAAMRNGEFQGVMA